MSRTWKPDTNAIRAGAPRPGIHGAVVLPIFQTANYEMDGDAIPGYIRYGNTPNHHALAERIAALEGAEAAMVTGSGMAATSAALISHVTSGDHILAQDSLYGGTFGILRDHLPALGVTATLVNPEDPAAWKKALTPRTKLFWCESITNPLVQVPNLPAIVSFCREHGLTSMIDNTFASPLLYNPVKVGFDLVMHSATKYLNGHSDLVAGALAGSASRIERCARSLRTLGGSLDPHACFLLERGMKTLGVRVRQQNSTALAIARALHAHPAVARVNYPGLPGSISHTRASEWFGGRYGAMLSFELHTGVQGAESMLSRLEIGTIAGSLGGAETLLVRPATASHRAVPAQERAAMGISDGLIRLSAGLEDPEDLIADLRQALEGTSGHAA